MALSVLNDASPCLQSRSVPLTNTCSPRNTPRRKAIARRKEPLLKEKITWWLNKQESPLPATQKAPPSTTYPEPFPTTPDTLQQKKQKKRGRKPKKTPVIAISSPGDSRRIQPTFSVPSKQQLLNPGNPQLPADTKPNEVAERASPCNKTPDDRKDRPKKSSMMTRNPPTIPSSPSLPTDPTVEPPLPTVQRAKKTAAGKFTLHCADPEQVVADRKWNSGDDITSEEKF